MDDKRVERAVAKLICGEDNATAFMLSKDKAITATHAIMNHINNNENIYLEFYNLTDTIITRRARPIDIAQKSCEAVTILEIDEEIELEYLQFVDSDIKKGDIFYTFGYPVVKTMLGLWYSNLISRKVDDGMFNPYDYDIDMLNSTNINNFSGLSGSPLIVSGVLCGVILSEVNADNTAISLGAISLTKFKEDLIKVNINLVSMEEGYLSVEDTLGEVIYELEDVDFSNQRFVAKLESANIFEHEIYQKDYYNAEILKNSVYSKKVPSEIQMYNNLKSKIHNIWNTRYIRYRDENDGSDLISSVYERIEEVNDTILKTSNNVSIIAKQGILHQMANECNLGWVKNYKLKMNKYLQERKKEELVDE